LDTGLEFSFLVVFSRLLDSFFGDYFNLVFRSFSWLDFYWFLFLFFRLLDHFSSFFSLNFCLWLNLLLAFFARWLLFLFLGWWFSLLKRWFWSFFSRLDFFLTLLWFTLFDNFFSFNYCLQNWRFSFLEGRFCNFLSWFNLLFTFFAWLLLNLFGGNWFTILDNYRLFSSLRLLLFLTFLTGFLNFLLRKNSFLSWWFGLNNLLWGLLLAWLFWRLSLFSFLRSSILSLHSLNCFFLNLFAFFIHWDLRGLNRLSLDNWSFFFLTRLWCLLNIFGLFLGFYLIFFWDDQSKLAWWVFLRILILKKTLLQWLVSLLF